MNIYLIVSFIRKFKIQVAIIIILLILWLVGLKGSVSTIQIEVSRQRLTAIIDGINYGSLNIGNDNIKEFEISFNGSNVPKQSSLQSEVVSIKQFDNYNSLKFESTRTKNTLPQSVDNGRIEIKLKNALFFELNINKGGKVRYVILYRVFRERDVNLLEYKGMDIVQQVSKWRQLEMPLGNILLIYLQLILSPFPILFILLVFLLAIRIFIKPNKSKKSILLKYCSRTLYCAIVAIIFSLMLLYLLMVMDKYMGRIPHDPDGTMYLWMAKQLAVGRLWLPAQTPFFTPSWHSFMINHHSVILWNYGHSLVFIPGIWLHNSWIMPPIIALSFIFILYKLISLLFGRFVSLSITILVFFSPFFQMHSVSFMSHNTAIFYLTIFIYAFVRLINNNLTNKMAFLAGLSLILLYYTRPLPAIGTFVSALVIIGYRVLAGKTKLGQCKMFLFSTIVVLGVSMIFMLIIYGNPIVTFYHIFSRSKFIGAGPNGPSILKGLTDNISQLLTLRFMILPGMSAVLLLLAMIGVMHLNYYLLVFILMSILFTFMGMATYDDPFGLYLGPRFIYELLPFIILLIASAFKNIQLILKNNFFAYILIFIFVGFCVYRSINGWILGNIRLWDNFNYFTPYSISGLKSFNDINNRLVENARRNKITNALIFVSLDNNWQPYGSVLHENTQDYNGDIVWAQDLKEKNMELMKRYSGRKVFMADYYKNEIVPYIYK